jgi:U4/U6 small nuclear ribonucleoprotein PRP31
MTLAHADLAKAYQPRFPELEELLPNPLQYKNAIRVIGNEIDLTQAVNDRLAEVLGSNQIITIAVASSTSSGRPLTDNEFEEVDRLATFMERLLEVQAELRGFVESSMEAIAPSVCALVGPSVAATIVGLAGGLSELTKIPACNLQVIGQVKQNSASRAGLSAATVKQHVGILANCDFVQSCPKHLKQKALKAIASKLALAARFDFVNVDTGRPRSAEAGLKFLVSVNQRVSIIPYILCLMSFFVSSCRRTS